MKCCVCELFGASRQKEGERERERAHMASQLFHGQCEAGSRVCVRALGLMLICIVAWMVECSSAAAARSKMCFLKKKKFENGKMKPCQHPRGGNLSNEQLPTTPPISRRSRSSVSLLCDSLVHSMRRPATHGRRFLKLSSRSSLLTYYLVVPPSSSPSSVVVAASNKGKNAPVEQWGGEQCSECAFCGVKR